MKTKPQDTKDKIAFRKETLLNLTTRTGVRAGVKATCSHCTDSGPPNSTGGASSHTIQIV